MKPSRAICKLCIASPEGNTEEYPWSALTQAALEVVRNDEREFLDDCAWEMAKRLLGWKMREVKIEVPDKCPWRLEHVVSSEK